MTDEQKKLHAVRERTGCGYSACQRALAESGGDVGRAVDLIRSRGEVYTTADARIIRSVGERVRGETRDAK